MEHDRQDPVPEDSPVGERASVLDHVERTTGHRPSISLRGDQGFGAVAAMPNLPDAATRSEAGKYVVADELGRGGVGTVHRAQDRELGREVAIKFLHDKFRAHAPVVHRFVEEAQIGGQLQHPGIVPVYDLGLTDDKPFFAMKLVKGRTLAELLAERESTATNRRRYLAIFEQIAQAMAYAHARGVVHRDLKPENVMIGAFGEVQVVDWGFGKVLSSDGTRDGDGEASGEGGAGSEAVATVRTATDGTQSVMGTVMGTPAYMPREQALGQIDRMDERADVFGLGAILCEILTGQPPYVGAADEVVGLAAMARLDDAHSRLGSCGADPELVDLTIQCLQKEPEDRPRSAEVVARRVHDYLAAAEAKIHEARVAAAEERVRAGAARTRQRYALGLVGVVALGLVASLWFWRDAEAQRGLAVRSATVAKQARAAAETNLANFNRLSHVVRLEHARERERELFPAWPRKTDAMRQWLEDDARELQDSLTGLRATLTALERRALPRTEEERAEQRRTHPRIEELSRLKHEHAALARAQAVRAGEAGPEPFPLVDEALPTTVVEFFYLAKPLVVLDRETFGHEAQGLALAHKALEIAPEAAVDRCSALWLLAVALFANGLDDEAVARAEQAVETATDELRDEYTADLAKLEAAIAAAPAVASSVAARIRALETELDARREWTFDSDADRFLHGTLRQLVTDIEAFVRDEVADVEQRLSWSERVEELTITRHVDRWRDARRAIAAADGTGASRLYARAPIELGPQIGLVPIGPNPVTKLWEFYHLRSAWDPDGETDPADLPIPSHKPDGTLPTAGHGMVFVLIPGGTFKLGAQKDHPGAPNHDPMADPSELPVRDVTLAPFLLSRYEMTQGQWARLTGGEYPSEHALGAKYEPNNEIGKLHPVENVSWTMCDELLSRHGLTLPTEAQWEMGCRGGTSTPWFTGDDRDSLLGHANVKDETALRVPPPWTGGEKFSDGFKGVSPAGSFAANPFGLHDIVGNVWEWCRDWSTRGYALPARPGDGLREPGPSGARTLRGGSFRHNARAARSALRFEFPPSIREHNLGVRPARELERRG